MGTVVSIAVLLHGVVLSRHHDMSLGGAQPEGEGGEAAECQLTLHHPCSFKLRFAEHRELGRSYVSLVKPLRLPATVTGKFYSRERTRSVDEAMERDALRRIEDMFRAGPREKHSAPLTASHQYGWWWEHGARMSSTSFADRRLHHHIRDSGWLKARLTVLAADDKLKQK
ncbi:uncharacterized protein LOC131854530 [Achroia grisella]|uniref:uncharacterized protein LOC131854530 n=1 Tax=Achroia grisella TaxID=688607 RepID=UPI0027D299BB|nr:uncharacterized protein LOC131854530 [Achroia grisella]